MEVDDEEKCLAYGYDIIGFVGNENNNRFNQTCSIEETQKALTAIKSLIQPFLMTEIIIVFAVLVVRALKQLRPI